MADARVTAPAIVVEDLALDELADLGKSLRDEQKRVSKALGTVEGEILRRMAAERQEMAITSNWVMRRTVSRSYEWDVPSLVREFQPMVSPAIWDECVAIEPPKPQQPIYKVNTNKVLSTAKKLGERAEAALSTCYRVDERAPRIEYEELPPEDRPL